MVSRESTEFVYKLLLKNSARCYTTPCLRSLLRLFLLLLIGIMPDFLRSARLTYGIKYFTRNYAAKFTFHGLS